MTTVSVFGGTGFLGRRLVRRLATEGATVRVAVRHPERARGLSAAGLDRVTVLCADVRDQASVGAAVAGAGLNGLRACRAHVLKLCIQRSRRPPLQRVARGV